MCKTNFFTHTICIVIFVVLILLSAGCGIPSYPYLYPPEAIGVTGEVKFKHDPKNGNPEQIDVFRGYEIFYRFYTEDPDQDTENINDDVLAEKDMKEKFTTLSFIRDIIHPDDSKAYNFGFRRLLIDMNNDNEVYIDASPPQLDVNENYYGDNFTVEITSDPGSNVVYLNLSYEENNHTVYRTAVYADETLSDVQEKHKEFYPVSDYTIEGDDRDSDIVDVQNINQDMIDNLEKLYVAFFAVPFGLDSVTPIYANGNHEGMEYIGSFELLY